MTFVSSAVLVFMLAGSEAVSGELDHAYYGKLHTSLNVVSDSKENGVTLTSNASHFGLRGSYPIKDRFAVIGQVEIEFNNAREEFSFGTPRNSFIGLRGSYGTILGGIHDTPLKTLGRKITYFEDTIGDFRSTTLGVDQRIDEVLIYELPSLENGFGGQLSWMLDQGDWTDSEAETASAYSGILYYAPADFMVGLGYQSVAAGNFHPTPGNAETETVLRGVGRFEMGKIGISALYQTIWNRRGADGLTAMTLGFEGMFMPAQQWRLKGSYFATDPNTGFDNNSHTQLALGADHIFDDVTFYVQYAVMLNDDFQEAGLGNNDWGGTVLPRDLGKSASGISLGLWWSF